MTTTRVTRWLASLLVAATALLAACGGDEPAPLPPVTATGTQPATVEPTIAATPTQEELEGEVLDAYLAYWEAYSEAVLRLDASLVEGHALGQELEGIRDEVEQLRAGGQAVRIVVEHDAQVASLSETEAFVLDAYRNNSYLVDPVTLEGDATAGPNEVIRDLFRLERTEGRWLVVQGGRVASD